MNDAANRTESDAQGIYIHLPDDHPLRKLKEYELRTPESPEFFGPVRRVNILVGPNNAGKSRFLRALHAAETFVRGPGPFHDWRRAREVAAELPTETLELLARIRGDGWPDLFPPSRSNRDSVSSVTLTREVVSSLSWRDVVEALHTPFPARESVVPRQMACHSFIAGRLFGRRPSETDRTIGDDMVVHAWTDPSTDTWRQVLECAGRHYLRVLLEEPPSRRRQESIRVKYFPAFRTALSIFGDTNALESTLHDCYGIPPNHPDAIVTGRRLYNQFDQAIRGKRKDRMRFIAFETWLSTQFFSGADVTLVPRHTQGTERPTIAVEIDGEERELENLGDGLQQLIILTFPLFMAEDGDAFFIEEPETHMHPGLQRAFLDVLFSDELAKKNLLIFLTSHSNHLLGAALERPSDVSLFRFQRLRREKAQETSEERSPRFEVTHVSRRDIALLEGLGVVNGSVFLAQSQIWVEGPSDIIYFRAYLKSLEAAREEEQRSAGHDDPTRGARFERLLENRDFVFVMYGGSLLDTIDFAGDSAGGTSPFAIGNRIFVIADADDGEEKTQRHARLEDLAAGSKGMMVYRKLEVREVENTVAAEHMKRAMRSLYVGMRKVSDEAVFDLPENELIGRHFEGAGVESIGSYVSKSGSWNEKTRLARAVCEAPLPWGELRPSTRTLALALDAFIRRACVYEPLPAPRLTP
jgi:hypothetical protein